MILIQQKSGEWPSDDENDETFTVDGETTPQVKRKRTKRTSVKKEASKLNEKLVDEHSDWGRLPGPVIAQIAQHMIRESGDFLRIQKCLGKHAALLAIVRYFKSVESTLV